MRRYDKPLIQAMIRELAKAAPGVMREVENWFAIHDPLPFPEALPAILELEYLIRHAPEEVLRKFNLEDYKDLPEERACILAGIFIANSSLTGFTSGDLEEHHDRLAKLADRPRDAKGFTALNHTLRRFVLVCAHLALNDEICQEVIDSAKKTPRAAVVKRPVNAGRQSAPGVSNVHDLTEFRRNRIIRRRLQDPSW